MKLFDRFSSFFRRTAPAAPSAPSGSSGLELRKFIAANNSRLIDWAVSYSKINADLKSDYVGMTLRARDLARNNEFVIGYLENLKRNVIGPAGFTLQSKALDGGSRLELERLWREYVSRSGGSVTLDERQSGRDFDVLVLRTLVIDGEVFIRRVFDRGSRFGYRYEVLDGLEIDPFYNVEDAGGGERVTMGVRYDSRGREKAFYLRRSKGDIYMTGEREELPASDVLHIFRKQFPDQARGYSALAGVILNLNQLDAYKEAELIHARIQACTMGIWEWNGQGTGDVLAEPDDKGEFVRDLKSGSFQIAPKGYTAKYLQSTSPNSQFDAFWKSMLRGASNALGVSYNKATGDYSDANYSNMRAASLEDRAGFEELQRFLAENWKDFQFSDFVRGLALSGLAPSSDFADLLRHRFFGCRFPWVDPTKEIGAKEKEYDLLLTDPMTELEMRGLDPDELLDRWKEWHEKIEARQIPFMVKPPLPDLPDLSDLSARPEKTTKE